MDYQSIDAHINRPKTMLEKEIDNIRCNACERIAFLRKVYPLKRWIQDRVILLDERSSLTISDTKFYISIPKASLEDVIEFIAGPLHQKVNCFWKLDFNTTIDLNSIKSYKLPDSNKYVSFLIYTHESDDCEVIAEEKEVTKKEVTYKFNCSPGGLT